MGFFRSCDGGIPIIEEAPGGEFDDTLSTTGYSILNLGDNFQRR
jgi:hypothetical protein